MVGVINFEQDITDQQKLTILAITREYKDLGYIKKMFIFENKLGVLIPDIEHYKKIIAELEQLKEPPEIKNSNDRTIADE